jgi:hypothetical protein
MTDQPDEDWFLCEQEEAPVKIRLKKAPADIVILILVACTDVGLEYTV